ncbi:MAG: calcium-binding protein [Thermoleophilaceae bacterium]
MKRPTIPAVLVTALAATFAATATPAHAAVSSASIVGGVATLNLDGADDNVTVAASGGLLVHGQATGGLNSGSDWDSATAGDQTVPANGTFVVVVNGGDGNDALAVLAKNSEIVTAALNGGSGDDVLTGSDTGDSLEGGDGNDRLVGAKGGDVMSGGTGNDTLVWNNGDGSDSIDGGAGNDATEVNGNPTLGDAFTLEPNAGRIKFQRTNLVPFTLDATTERFEVNGLGGDDSVTASDGVGALTLLSVDGGAGVDTVNGSDGPDLILGGEGNDILNGGDGDDRIVGDRGNDTMNGGSGDDTLVWNNGDATDVMNGDGGRDDVEVNGAPAAGDVFTVQPKGARIKFDRSNLVPFSLDIGSSETLHANGLGGDDSITVGAVGAFEVTGSGGSGNDTLTGGGSSETFLGGSGNDTINPGGGIDVVSGDEGDDQVNVRDKTADLARGGAGNDSVVADNGQLDILDGFEAIDRTPNEKPGPVNTATQPVTIGGGKVKVKRGVALIKVSAPAGASGNSTGTLTVRTAKAVRLAGLKVTLQLGSARYDIAPGVSQTLKVKLAKGSQRVAGGKRQLKVVAVASTGASGQIAQSSRRLTLALGTATKTKR